jgi:GT2 family glycosyltransferase
MLPETTVSIVIGSDEQLVFGCLRSLPLAAEETPLRIVVVANPASAETIQRLRREHPDVEVVENEERIGFAANHNSVIRGSESRYVLVLNDDTVLHAGAIDESVRYLEEHPETGIVGAKLLNEDGSYQNSVYAWPRPWQSLAVFAGKFFPGLARPSLHRLYRRAVYRRDDSGTKTEPTTVESVKGAYMVVRREVVDVAGLMDEVTYVYEEIEWQRRMREVGYEAVYLPLVQVTHFGSVTIRGFSMALPELLKATLNYHDKYSRAWSTRALRIALLLLLWIRRRSRRDDAEARATLEATRDVLMRTDQHLEAGLRHFVESGSLVETGG